MVFLAFSSAHALKQAVTLLMEFVKPGNEVIFFFWPKSASLQAVSYDGRIQSFVPFDLINFSRYICDRSCCYTLNIDELNAVVNLAADSNYVSILGTAFKDFHLTIKHVQTFRLQVFDMIIDRINPPPKPPAARLAIQTKVFETMIHFFNNFDPENVTVTVLSEKVTFAVKHHRCILSRERHECKVVGVPLGVPDVTNFRWEDLRSKLLKRATDMSNYLVMYLPGPDGTAAPPALACILHPVGRILFYFISKDDDDDHSPAAKKCDSANG